MTPTISLYSMDICSTWRQLRSWDPFLEPKWLSCLTTTGFLVCFCNDYIVSQGFVHVSVFLPTVRHSIVIPWFTIRKVKVDVETVRLFSCFRVKDPFLMASLAITQGCDTPIRTRNATRITYENIARTYHGISCLRNHFVRQTSLVHLIILHWSLSGRVLAPSTIIWSVVFRATLPDVL